MNNILQNTYIIESILVTGILYSIYLLVLRNRPTLVFNRISILAMSLLGFLVPLFDFSLPQNSELPTSTILLEGVTTTLSGNQTSTLNILNWKTIYLLITSIFLLHFSFQILHIIRLKQKSKGEEYKLITGKYPHFSFFNTIFINRELTQEDSEIKMILEHEKVHVKQLHSIDILLFEILKIIFWFNPFIWLIKNLAVENHEYLADKGMLNTTSISTYDYFNELLQSSLFTYKISIVNNFNHSLLKKRIKMMTKQNLKSIERFIPLFIVPVFFFVATFFACSESQKVTGETNDKVELMTSDGEALFQEVDLMPKFAGGDFMNFKRYIQQNLIYPSDAVEGRIMGTVYVQFVVGSDGKVKDIEIVRSVSSSLDAEANRVIESSPDWTPAENKGKKVAVQFTMPIKFLLQNENWTVENSRKEKAEAQKQALPDPSSGIIVTAY